MALAQVKIASTSPQTIINQLDIKKSESLLSGYKCLSDLNQSITLLAPEDHTGLTASARPTLFYHFSKKTKASAFLTLTEEEGKNTVWLQHPKYLNSSPRFKTILLQHPISLNSSPGIKSFSLPPEVKLKVGKTYYWGIIVICHLTEPILKINLQLPIERVEPSLTLKQQLLLATSERERAHLYARFGFWYDALASISQSKNPQASSDLRDLLKQVGITQKRIGF